MWLQNCLHILSAHNTDCGEKLNYVRGTVTKEVLRVRKLTISVSQNGAEYD
jgi:sarcosine oxidase delta subunit